MYVTGLPANQAGAEFEVVVALGPTDRTVVLERIVDVLKRNIRAIANVSEGTNIDRRQGVGVGAKGGHRGREANHGLIDILTVIEREGEIVDARECRPEVDQEGGCEDMGESEGVLLRPVGSGAVEVVPAAADFNAVDRSKCWWREGVDLIIGEATEEEIVVVELMVDPSVVGVVVLRLVRADGEVVGDVAIGGLREELQIVQHQWIDAIDERRTREITARGGQRAVARREQRLGRSAVLAVNVIPLSQRWHGAGIGNTRDLAESFIVKIEESSVSPDGSADATAVLILAQFGLGSSVLKEIAAVEDVVAEVLVDRAVELIGARAGHDIDHTTGRTASLGRVAVGLNGDLLNAFDVGLDSNGANDAFVVVDSVDYPVIEAFVLSIDGESGGVGAAIIGTAAAAKAIALALIGAGDEGHELNEITTVQWKVLHRFCGYGGAYGRTIRLKERRACRDFDDGGLRA